MLNSIRMEERIVARMEAARIPGLALGIVARGETVYARGFGVTSVEDGGTPVTPQTLFPIGSTTKPLTGTMLMRLVEQGALALDEPIVSYVPDLVLHEAGAAGRVTLRMLLGHTAGLPWEQITPARMFGPRDPGALATYVRDEIPRLPLVAPPGSRWSYSNPGINLAAHAAERVTGASYPDLMRALIFEPFGMERTTFDPTIAMTYPLAKPHACTEDGALRVRHQFPDNAAQYPAAFAYSTVLDLARFALLHLDGGSAKEARLLRPETIAAMQAPHAACDTPGLGTAYGLTFSVDTYAGIRRVGHPGGISSFACEFVLLPDAGIAVIAQCNRAEDFPAPTRAIVDDVLSELTAAG